MMEWGKLDLEDGEKEFIVSSDKLFRLERKDSMLFIEYRYGDEINCSECHLSNGQNVYIEPSLPDRPLILKSLNRIVISPSEKIDVIIEIPYWINILVGTSAKKQSVLEIPTKYLSKSFFGSPENGEVAYSLSSPFYKDISMYAENENSVYCSLTIHNKSTQLLQFEKILLRVPSLIIYKGEELLYSGSVQITFTGQDQLNQVLFRKSAPQIEHGLKAISQPRFIEKNSILHKSFYLIKNIYNGY